MSATHAATTYTQGSSREPQACVGTFIRHCVAYGVPFRLYAADQHTLASMVDVLPFGTEIVDAGLTNTACFTLPGKGHPRFSSLLARVEQQILLHVGVHAPNRTFVHAGVVGWQGRALVLPGDSCAGKTTLVAELVKLGAVYYSDEYALLDSSGMVHPYARDLHMREPGGLQQTKVSPKDLSGETASGPALVAHIAIVKFTQGAEWSPQPLTPGLAVLEMLRYCIPARRQPVRVLTTLNAVMRTARACHSARGDAKATAQLLLQTLDSGGPPV